MIYFWIPTAYCCHLLSFKPIQMIEMVLTVLEGKINSAETYLVMGFWIICKCRPSNSLKWNSFLTLHPPPSAVAFDVEPFHSISTNSEGGYISFIPSILSSIFFSLFSFLFFFFFLRPLRRSYDSLDSWHDLK